MRGRIAILVAALGLAAALVIVLSSGGGSSDSSLNQLQGRRTPHKLAPVPGAPGVEVISPRNGARQTSGAVVVRVVVHNFHLAPAQFGGEPELQEGHIRFQLHRVPNCIAAKRLRLSLKNPLSSGSLLGASFDYPEYAGLNGVLAARIGVAGSYSPSTRPVIYYRNLPAGFYHVVIGLAQNDGSMTPYHGVTNFEILPKPGHGPSKHCKRGEIPSSGAAASL